MINQTILGEKPLVTFAIICYKQEQFIEEAVMSALSQTYSPLEIVISDDCSRDNTFQVIEKIISNYTGPHKVIINKNEKNLGLADNINRVWDLSSGELLVIQAGDDVSVPHRTSTLVNAWLSTIPSPLLVYSDQTIIDEESHKISSYKNVRTVDYSSAIKHTLTGVKPFVIGGCTAAYARSIHTTAGSLESDVIAEDFVYSFRALLAGCLVGVTEPLVMYRKNSASIIGRLKSGSIQREQLLKAQLAKLIEYKKAIAVYGNVNSYLQWRLNRQTKAVEQQLKMMSATFSQRICIMVWALSTGRLKLLREFLKFVAPKNSNN